MLSFFKLYVKPYSLYYIFGFLFLIITNDATTQIPLVVQKLLDTLSSSNTSSDIFYETHIIPLLWKLVRLACVLAATRTLSRILFFTPGRLVERNLRQQSYKQLMFLPQSFFHQQKKGDLMSRLVNDITNLRLMAGFACLQVVNIGLMFGFVFYRMSHINLTLTVLILAPIPIVVILVRHLAYKMYTYTLNSQQSLGKVTNTILDAFKNMTTIQVFGLKDVLSQKLHKNNQDLKTNNLLHAKTRSIIFPLVASLASLGQVILFGFGSFSIIKGHLTIGEFVALSSLVILLAWPTAGLAWIISLFQRGKSSWKRISEILDHPSLEPSFNTLETPKKLPTLTVKNLTIMHKDISLLENISFDLKPGERLGIFGPTGSGKSLLARSVVGLMPIQKGSIHINAEDITQDSSIKRSAYFSYVAQQSFLFSDSTYNNIAYKKENPSYTVAKSAQLSHIKHDIEQFDEQFETLVGEKGVLLSGGQKLRLCLSRSFYRPHPILVLDDPLAAVDAETEHIILKNLEQIKSTMIIISHRISAIKDCSKILILDKGRVQYAGNHSDLLNQSELYRSSWAYQEALEDL